MPKPEHWLKTPLRTFISLRNKIGHGKSLKKKREKENQDWYLKKINSAESESENNR